LVKQDLIEQKGELVLLISDWESDEEETGQENKNEENSIIENLLKTNQNDDTARAILIALKSLETSLRGEIRSTKAQTDRKLKRHRASDKNWKTEYRQRLLDLASDVPTIREMTETIDNQALKIKELETAIGQMKIDADSERLDKIERQIKCLALDVDNLREATRAAVNKNAFLIQTLQRKNREKNVRAQGISIKQNESNAEAVVRTFRPIVPKLNLSDIEFATKTFKKGFTFTDDGSGKTPPKPTLLVGFNTKEIRDLVFFDSKKLKDKLPEGVIVREDLIKRDLKAKDLAKDQMEAAWNCVPKKKSKFTYGFMVIEGNKTEITNIRSLDRFQCPTKYYKE
jgi:hypothetical protein